MFVRTRLAVLGLVFGAALSFGCHEETDLDTRPEPEPVATEDGLRDDMRVLWTEHVAWTRFFLMEAIDGLAARPDTTERLLLNQTHIGDAIRPFYGDDAGDELTDLLEVHIVTAADLVDAAVAGDDKAFQVANDAWYDNAEDIAAFLAAANPAWPQEDMEAMMEEHLDLTLQEATARLTGDWDKDVQIYDRVQDQILHMADMLTDGLVTQFPDDISRQAMSNEDRALHLGMRDLWEDHVIWTRVFIISSVANLDDTDAATARLLENQADIGDAIKPYFGIAAGDHLTELLEQHILIAADVLYSATYGGEAAVEEANAAWRENAQEIASFLAGLNSEWDEEHLAEHMLEHLDLTLSEASARLGGDYPADIAYFDQVETQILDMADELSFGLAARFPTGPVTN